MEENSVSVNEQRIRKLTSLYYSRPEIQKIIFDFSKNREICPRYFEGFGRRPDVLEYPGDVFGSVKKGATSFHCSEELWKDPLKIKTGMNEKQLNELRIGWDFILDIDSKYIDYSKIMAIEILNVLKFHGIKNVGVKFSGSKGFHLIIPWKAFPKEINGVKTSEKFPEWPRILVKYIIEQTRNKLIERISELERPNKYVRDYKAPKEVMPDLVLVSPRHLFRMPYSVDFDEPICTKKDKKINITKIGDFVDQFFKKEGKIQTADISHLDYKTPSLNFKDNNTRFSKINNVIRHKIDENIFSICLESGREVKVTSGHSLFVLRDSKIDTIKGNEIKLGDYIVVLKKIPENEDKLNCINLTDELMNVSKEEKKNIFLFDFDKSVYDKLYTLKIPERKKTQIYNWKVYNILPLDAYEILIKKFPLLKSVFVNSKIKICKHGGAKVGIQNNLKVNKELMRLLGYYVSEGYCDCKRSRMNFSFGAHEEELIEDCVKILKSLNLNPKLRKPHETATQIEINSAIFNFILSFLFKCGKNALEKRVPSIIWNVDSELKKEFLKGYINGDGHIEKKWAKIIMSTASKGLQEDLCFLLNSLGRGYSLSKRKPAKWNKSNKDQYIIIVQGKRDVEELGFVSHSNRIKESLMERFPIKELGLEKLILASRLRNQYINKKIIDRNKDFIKKLNPPKEILNLINGDIAFLKVKEIKRINTQHKYVYDLSVENDENFVGGNCILLHNSLHEKTSLASIVLRQEEIENFNMKDADPMKLSSSEIRNFSPNSREGEASEILVQALDWYEGSNKEKEKEERDFSPIKLTNLSENHFPPCIKNILKGLSDGKKRALFILINLFRSVGMDKDELEKRIYNWNKKNEVPLQDGYIKAQLSWAYKRKPIMPPNCKEFYQGIGVCEPDNFCRTLKNPINYVVRKNLRKDKK